MFSTLAERQRQLHISTEVTFKGKLALIQTMRKTWAQELLYTFNPNANVNVPLVCHVITRSLIQHGVTERRQTTHLRKTALVTHFNRPSYKSNPRLMLYPVKLMYRSWNSMKFRVVSLQPPILTSSTSVRLVSVQADKRLWCVHDSTWRRATLCRNIAKLYVFIY